MELDKIVKEWGDSLAIDLKQSLEAALKKGGRKGEQEAALNFKANYKITPTTLTVSIEATGDYWRYIENGRKPGKMPPADRLGKKWQVSTGILKAPQIVQEIQLKYYQKKGLKRNVKKLPYDKAAKQLGFIIARSIGKKGVKPRPFLNVITQERLNDLQAKVSQALQREIEIELNNLR